MGRCGRRPGKRIMRRANRCKLRFLLNSSDRPRCRRSFEKLYVRIWQKPMGINLPCSKKVDKLSQYTATANATAIIDMVYDS